MKMSNSRQAFPWHRSMDLNKSILMRTNVSNIRPNIQKYTKYSEINFWGSPHVESSGAAWQQLKLKKDVDIVIRNVCLPNQDHNELDHAAAASMPFSLTNFVNLNGHVMLQNGSSVSADSNDIFLS